MPADRRGLRRRGPEDDGGAHDASGRRAQDREHRARERLRYRRRDPGRHARQAAREPDRFPLAARPRQDRAGPDAARTGGPLVSLRLRTDRPRSCAVYGEAPEMSGVSDRVPVPVEPGVNYTAAWSTRSWSAPRRRARRITRRSSSSRPPHTPASWNVASDHSRQSVRTEHESQTFLAAATWESASSEVPIGKNSSGSSPMHRASESHHISSGSFLNRRSVIWSRHLRISPNLQRSADDSV